MSRSGSRPCDDCDTALDRRAFLAAAGALGAGVYLGTNSTWAAPSVESAAENVVSRFYQSLTPQQKQTIVFPFEHDLRQRINANWHVTKPLLKDDFYTKEQRALATEIVQKVMSEDGYKRLLEQTHFDDGGLEAYSCAVFGTPGSDKFQWELTGRHLTLRADGNSVDRAAFGGGIVYGHGEENPKENLYYYQTKQVNEVFKALDAKQSAKALVAKAPSEAVVPIQGASGRYPGLPISELSSDQKSLVEQTLKVLLAPYRQEDVDEVFAILKQTGGVDQLHCAFYQQEDLENDHLWDIWRVEGPSFVWHFRGAPHVHAYINIGVKA